MDVRATPLVSLREVEQVERNMAPSIVMRWSVEEGVRARPPVSLREVEQVERNIAPSIVMRGSVEVDVRARLPVSLREVEQVEVDPLNLLQKGWMGNHRPLTGFTNYSGK